MPLVQIESTKTQHSCYMIENDKVGEKRSSNEPSPNAFFYGISN